MCAKDSRGSKCTPSHLIEPFLSTGLMTRGFLGLTEEGAGGSAISGLGK